MLPRSPNGFAVRCRAMVMRARSRARCRIRSVRADARTERRRRGERAGRCLHDAIHGRSSVQGAPAGGSRAGPRVGDRGTVCRRARRRRPLRASARESSHRRRRHRPGPARRDPRRCLRPRSFAAARASRWFEVALSLPRERGAAAPRSLFAAPRSHEVFPEGTARVLAAPRGCFPNVGKAPEKRTWPHRATTRIHREDGP